MKKNLLIASNNITDAKGIESAFQTLEDIRLLPSVFTGRDAIDTIFARDVDLLILDLFLHDLDGICVLDFIGKLSEDRRPLVFVTTALADDRLLQIIKDRVIYCFTKPLKYDLIQLRVLEFMRLYERETEKADEVVDILESQIAAGIRAIGVPAHLKGYYYLRDAIRIYAMSESPVDLSITNDIYPTVAKIYNTRPPRWSTRCETRLRLPGRGETRVRSANISGIRQTTIRENPAIWSLSRPWRSAL